MKAVALIAITVGWTLAAVTIWWAGRWAESTHRWDGCTYVIGMSPEPFWACPAESPSPARPTRDEGGDQV